MVKTPGYEFASGVPGTSLRIAPRPALPMGVEPSERLERRPAEHTADALFWELDGSELDASGRQWTVEVYSVTDQPSGRWLQLGLKGAQDHLLTLRLPNDGGTDEAARALAAWLADPDHTPDVPDAA